MAPSMPTERMRSLWAKAAVASTVNATANATRSVVRFIGLTFDPRRGAAARAYLLCPFFKGRSQASHSPRTPAIGRTIAVNRRDGPNPGQVRTRAVQQTALIRRSHQLVLHGAGSGRLSRGPPDMNPIGGSRD